VKGLRVKVALRVKDVLTGSFFSEDVFFLLG
jgi:hypothetical protein